MQQLKDKIKRSNAIGSLYLFGMSALIFVLKLVVKPKPKRILFTSYSGRQVSDSPKELFLSLMEDARFDDYELVFALNNPEEWPDVPDDQKIAMNSPVYFWHLLRSKYWVANSSIERLVPFQHPDHVYIQFWHGIPMKHLGVDEEHLSFLVDNWYKNAEIDYLITSGEFDTEVMKRIFPKAKQVEEIGSLRAAISERRANEDLVKFKKKLGIPADSKKKVLLYVPTFREYQPEMATNFSYAFIKALSAEYEVVYRGHYFTNGANISGLHNVSKLSLYKLFLVTDILVTDYSSVLFDFAIFNKPIYLFQPDILEYREKRGLYLTGRDLKIPTAYSEAMLWNMLKRDYDYSKVERIRHDYNNHDVHAAVERIKQIILE
ncbi:CDP-glycerol glycerophosphotransferase family protein [Weissella confusa]|uniref:CDP-glycerol glycerophosphotransferase family protein n=1 Tax=Weissella confusa TaxID=1583 RepID=UPI00396F6131